MPENAARFLSQFTSFRAVKEGGPPASAHRGAAGTAGARTSPHRAGPLCRFCRVLCMSPRLTQPQKPFIWLSATKKMSTRLFWGKKCVIDSLLPGESKREIRYVRCWIRGSTKSRCVSCDQLSYVCSLP